MPLDKFCDCFGCTNSAECYCDKCNNYLCSEHEFDDICSQYYCRQNKCRNKATWTCGGCNIIFCESHSPISNHNCITCYYCSRKATSFCTGLKGCDRYVCSAYNCESHIRACPLIYYDNSYKGCYPTTPCPRCHGLRYFNNGRDACSNCQASGFVW